MSERIKGVLHLQLITDGTVAFIFRPDGNHGAGSSPLSAKNVDIAQEDLARTWGFTPNKARVTIEELKMSGHVHRDTDVDAAMWRTFSRALRRLRSKTPETDPPDHTWDI